MEKVRKKIGKNQKKENAEKAKKEKKNGKEKNKNPGVELQQSTVLVGQSFFQKKREREQEWRGKMKRDRKGSTGFKRGSPGLQTCWSPRLKGGGRVR